ncbi:amidophosphoribosyltransferase [Selenomonas sp. TAMA-11512]|uniref:amidophosphoribosyltransferase n=1 Tax=Selenomonas sp. TAMA-11512 TaxID=3095337 RepID=UPI00309152C9|nr:amidophosphoribosyltransferase [Selenomonas sp. TAMA-11512]
MSLHEECGIFGVYAPRNINAAALTYYGLYALQHRGQESAGIVVNNDGVFSSYKDLGLVSDVFTNDTLKNLPMGTMAVGHCRYGTTGETNRANVQPLEVNHQKGKLALAHNGNLSNTDILRDELELKGAIFHTTIDTETIVYLITQERLKTDSIEEAVSRAVGRLEGAFSLCLMSSAKMIAVRDPQGMRPVCYGMTSDGVYVVASESCALTAVGAKFIRDLKPGEILAFTEDGVTSRLEHCNKKQRSSCIFEYIYFARPDSEIDGISIHASRLKAGRILYESFPVDADVVIGVPDSGLDAALGYSQASGIPYGIGLIKNKYIGRTFIAPGQENRMDKVRIKLAPIIDTVKNKRVILIDDSIVRGTTSQRIVNLLRQAGTKEIHLFVTAPPFKHPCYYGTDIDSVEHLIACNHSIDEIKTLVGADSLGYFPMERLSELCDGLGYCSACFSGSYPTAIPRNTRKDRFERPLSEKKKA